MRPRIVQRYGEDRLANHLRQNHRINRTQLRIGHRRKFWVVPLAHPHHLEFRSPALHLQPVVLGSTQVNLFPRQAFRYLECLARANRHSPFLLNLSRQRHHHRDLEICRCTRHAIRPLATNEHVGQNRHGALSVGYAVRQIESPEKLALVDPNVHRSPSSCCLVTGHSESIKI